MKTNLLYVKGHRPALETDGGQELAFIPSLHTEFAKAALQGMLAAGADKSNSIQYIVNRSIAYADIMIEELERADRHELEKR